ncbi:hypothetical protein AALA61_03735, partial [Oscillospiraceae bacterium 42-9]
RFRLHCLYCDFVDLAQPLLFFKQGLTSETSGHPLIFKRRAADVNSAARFFGETIDKSHIYP